MGQHVAIVVVAGVGDDQDGHGAEQIAEGLVRHEGYCRMTESIEWFPVSGDVPERADEKARVRKTRRLGLRSGSGTTEVDLYQFWWADLSRFPAALRSFVVAFLGLFLEMPAVGRAALVGGTEIGRDSVPLRAEEVPGEGTKGAGPRRAAAGSLGALEWLIAVPIMIASLTLVVLVGLITAALALRSAHAPDWATGLALGFAGVAVVGGGYKASRLYGRTGRPGAVEVTVAILAAALGTVLVRLLFYDRQIDLALSDTLVAGIAYLFRPLWLAALLAAVVTMVLLIVRVVQVRRDPAQKKDERDRMRRSNVTTLLGVVAGPLGVAVLLAALSAGVGAASKPLTDRAEYTASAGSPGGPTAAERDAVLDILGSTFVRPAPDPEAVSTPETTPWCLRNASDWVPSSRDCIPAYGLDEDRPLDPDYADLVLTAYEWGAFALGQALAPLVAAAITGGVVLGILILTFLVYFLATRIRPSLRSREPAERTARRISWLAGSVDKGLGPMLFVAIPVAVVIGAAAWLPGVWTPGTTVLQSASLAAALAGGLAAGIFLLARILGLSPGALAGGRANELARSILDRPYDVATYLREAPQRGGGDRSRRERMLRRYGALLRHIAEGGSRGPEQRYDRIVLVAHSQGTVLSVTMLHEPPPGLPDDVRLITFGTPLRQLYRQRLPRQFGWLDALPSNPWRYLSQDSRLTEWVNLATPGDLVGRTVFAGIPEPWDDRRFPRREKAGAPIFVEFTLDAGGHSTYWSHPELYERLNRMIQGRSASEP